MVEHVQLGTEVLSLDFDSLLCEHCKAKIEAAREAKRALQTFNELVSGRSAPPRAEPQVPGTKLTRDERLAKAQRLLAASGAVPAAPALPKGATQTSNGTILAQPWQHLPRKQIKKRAEADLQRVIAGKMQKQEWCDKHGYSRSLLEKRLSILAPGTAYERPSRGKQTHAPPPSYAPPKQRLTDADMLRVLRKEITGNRLATELGMPSGTVYRIIEDNERRLRKAVAARGPQTRPNIVIPDKDWRALYDGETRQTDLGRKYGLTSAGILYRYKIWMAANQLAPRFSENRGKPTIQVPEQDLARAVTDRDYITVLARKHGCSISAMRSKVRQYGLRYGVPQEDEDKVAEQIVNGAPAPSDDVVGDLFEKLDGATSEGR